MNFTFSSTLSRPRGAARTVAARAGSLALLAAAVLADTSQAQTSEPLLQSANMTYLGGFALDNSWPSGNLTFQYGGAPIAFYQDPKYGATLYVGGHFNCGSCVGQVQIPSASTQLVNSATWSALPMATTIQPLADITQGTLSNIMNGNNGNNNLVDGLLVGNGRILVGANNVYAVDGNITAPGQIADIAVQNSLNPAAPGVFSGWTTVGGSSFAGAIRSQAGWMAWIPAEWQSALGGDALTGQGSISIISTTSSGASANIINSSTVGTAKPVQGHTVIYYNVNVASMCGAAGCEATQNNEFNLTSTMGGMIWVPGTRTVLYVGGHGTGPYCYGSFTGCGSTDTWRSDVKGPHAPPYRNQVWAYDANDLVKVKNGTLAAGAIQPYAYWPLAGMAVSPVGNTNGIVDGVAIDPKTLRMYMTVNYGANPRVEVWQITLPGGSSTTSTTTPDSPSGVTVQ